MKIDKPVDIDGVDLDAFVKKHEYAVVDCWSPSCPPCVMLAPIIHDLAKKHAGKVVFGKVNFSDSSNQMVAAKYGISGIPTLLIFRKGKLVNRLVGYRSKSELEIELEL